MESNSITSSQKIAVIKAKTKPWLGWEISFEKNLPPGMISQLKPLIEKHLNKYLQVNVNVIENSLITPFTCTLVASSDTLVHNFKVRVHKGGTVFQVLFNYPSEPILRVHNFILECVFENVSGMSFDGKSQPSSVRLKPPPH